MPHAHKSPDVCYCVYNNKLRTTCSTPTCDHLAQSFFLQHFRPMGVKQSTRRLSTRQPVDPAPAPPSHRVPNVQFRVLIIGRANAGKTSILQRVCDTTESPVIYRSGPSGTHHQVCAHSQWRIRSHHDPSRLNSNPQ